MGIKEKLEKAFEGIDLPANVSLEANKIEITFEVPKNDMVKLDPKQKITSIIEQLVLSEDYFVGRIIKEYIANWKHAIDFKTKIFNLGIEFEGDLIDKTFVEIYAKKVLRGVLFGGYNFKTIHLENTEIHLFYSKNDISHNFLVGNFEKLHLVLKNEYTGAVHEIDAPRGTSLKFFEMSPIDIKNCKIEHFSMINLDGDFYDKKDIVEVS